MPTVQCRTSAQFDQRPQLEPRPARGTCEHGPRSRRGLGGGEGGDPHREVRLDLHCDEDAPGRARDRLRRLEGIGWVLGDAMLVTTELVSNAVRHSGATANDRVSVAVKLDGRHLRITVVDPGRSGDSARARDSGDAFGGFGLQLVTQLASRWGAERIGGYRVWAELDLSAPTRSANERS